MLRFLCDQAPTPRFSTVGAMIVVAALSGCSVDESAMFCLEQAPDPTGIAVSNQCNKTVIVKADDGEKLIIATGLTHHLLGSGKQLGACFAPKEPQIVEQTFRCD